MKLLKLERIGDGSPRSPTKAKCLLVSGIGSNGFIIRKDMMPNRDYSNANSVGTRGVYDYYILKPGCIYEVYAPISWKRIDHYFLMLTDTEEKIRLSYEEMIECLSGGLVSMC